MFKTNEPITKYNNLALKLIGLLNLDIFCHIHFHLAGLYFADLVLTLLTMQNYLIQDQIIRLCTTTLLPPKINNFDSVLNTIFVNECYRVFFGCIDNFRKYIYSSLYVGFFLPSHKHQIYY